MDNRSFSIEFNQTGHVTSDFKDKNAKKYVSDLCTNQKIILIFLQCLRWFPIKIILFYLITKIKYVAISRVK